MIPSQVLGAMMGARSCRFASAPDVPGWDERSLALTTMTLTVRSVRYLLTSLATIAFGMTLQ
jgi:hypothetical protein